MNSIRFGRKKVLSITSEGIRNTILSKIRMKYLIDIDKRGYKFLDKTTIFEVKNSEHFFCLNTFGPKYLLFVTQYNKKNYCVYISKKDKTMVLARYRFHDDLYKDTLFEGELIKDENMQWFFYISDIYVNKGEDIRHRPVEERITAMRIIIEDEYVQDDYFETCRLITKKYFDTSRIDSVYHTYVDRVHFRTNGYLFKNNVDAKQTDILYIFPECRNNNGQQQQPQKKTNRYREEDDESDEEEVIDDTSEVMDRNTAFFKVCVTDMPDVYELYCSNNAKYGHASIPNMEVSKFMNDAFGIKDDSDSDSSNSDDDDDEESTIKSRIMECKYDEQFKKWCPIKAFDDGKKSIDKIENVRKIESKFI